MDADKLSFLDETPEPETEAMAPVPEQIEAPEQSGEQPAVPPTAVEPKAEAIPIQALLDERDRRQRAERELEEQRQWRANFEAQQRQAQQQAPDFFEDPDQRLQYERQSLNASVMRLKLEQSRFLAEREFGADLVKETYAFFDQNPALSHQFVSHPSPFHAAVEFYKRQKVAEEIGADPEAWRQREREKLLEQLRAEAMAEVQTTAQVQPKPKIPGSLATAPAAGRAGEPRARGTAFDAAFGS
jgi:hypothetical protein